MIPITINRAASSKRKLKRFASIIESGIISLGKYILFTRLLLAIILLAPLLTEFDRKLNGSKAQIKKIANSGMPARKTMENTKE